jgi:hypothetical protein
MESDEIVKYFGDSVERVDETPLIRQACSTFELIIIVSMKSM